MTNVYDFLQYQPESYKQFVSKNILVALYDCPQSRERDEVFTHHSYLTFVVSGSKLIHRQGTSRLFKEGNLEFVKKGGFIQELFLGAGLKALSFYLPDAYLKKLVQEFRQFYRGSSLHRASEDSIIDLSVNETTKSFIQTVLNFFELPTPPTETVLEERFRELFYSIVINPENQEFLSYLTRLGDLPRTSLYEVMEANYMYNLSLSEYARIANLSLATFKREFSKTFTTSPAQWLIQKRLVYAQTLLNTTDKSIADIVMESGFENGSHFSRVFKDKFGLTPLHYRKQKVLSAIPYTPQAGASNN